MNSQLALQYTKLQIISLIIFMEFKLLLSQMIMAKMNVLYYKIVMLYSYSHINIFVTHSHTLLQC